MNQPENASLESAKEAKSVAKEIFEKLLGDVSIGLFKLDDGYGIKVGVQKEIAPNLEMPSQVSGVPIKVESIGDVKKRD